MTGWHPTRSEGLRRLEAFVPRAGHVYARNRNFDRGRGGHIDVSTLSPWIRHRLLREREVIIAVLQHHTLSAAEKFIQEVFWRTYWKGWLELRPGVWTEYRAQVASLICELESDAALHRRWQAATDGKTGIECFDGWAAELIDTGYLHNHARMWFASIWIFTLGLPWELGADFFLRHLLDGDPASNTLSWRWVAGLQTRGKTYLARAANITRFTEGRFNPIGELSNAAPALPADPAPDAMAPPNPSPPELDLPTGLLITEEDLTPGLLLPDTVPDRNIAVLNATGWRSPLSISRQVQSFVDGAIKDTVERRNLPDAVRVDLTDTDRDMEKIVEWAMQTGLRQLVTPYTPVGPASEAMATLGDSLGKQRINLVPILRDYDRRAWPHATRGFFAFRRQIPALVQAILDSEV